MGTENSFNGELSKELRKLHPRIYHIKVSDKFTAGISDFLIFFNTTGIALEVKYLEDWPKSTSLLLAHPFTGEQQTFLESIDLTHNLAFGLVAVRSEKKMYAIPRSMIPLTGNWKTQEFTDQRFISFDFKDVMTMIMHIAAGSRAYGERAFVTR